MLTPQGVCQGTLLVTGEIDGSTPTLFAISDGAPCTTHRARGSRRLLERLQAIWRFDSTRRPSEKLSLLHACGCSDVIRRPRFNGRIPTLLAAELRGRDVLIYQVGDSPAFLIQGGQVRRLTRDHSVLERMIEQGLLVQDQAQGYDGLDRNFAAHADDRPLLDVLTLKLQDGDTLRLASGGLSVLALDRMAGCVTADLQASARALLASAVVSGSDDNISILLVRLETMPEPNLPSPEACRAQ